MKIELLYIDACPGAERLLPRLRELAQQAGDAELECRRIADPEAAAEQRFVGSPTVRIDGVDVEPGMDRTSYALCCRLYPGGSTTPPEEWITARLGLRPRAAGSRGTRGSSARPST